MAGPELDIRSNTAAIAVRYDQAPKLIAKTIVKVLRTIGAGVVSYVARQKLAGQVLGARTGNTRRALFYKVFVDGDARDAGVIVGVDRRKAPGARAQEYGATIVPKRAKHLAVPLPPALTGKGVARVSAREFMDNPESLGFTSAFVNQKKTAIMGVRDAGPGGFDDDEDVQVEPVFALKDRVVLPERSFLRSGVDERREWIREQLGMSVQEGIARSLGGES